MQPPGIMLKFFLSTTVARTCHVNVLLLSASVFLSVLLLIMIFWSTATLAQKCYDQDLKFTPNLRTTAS